MKSCAQTSTLLLKKIDGLRVLFLSAAAAESRRDLLDPLTWGILSSHTSFRSCNGAVTQSVYLFEKDLYLKTRPERKDVT
ncbi:hypothetical protein Y032_0022g539 [Ancylostoma ceylanicum]|uniref:Uncharacterized protein n=1 Tax=Ancylostoma ceylanicum TaxID=53326 RepID=A0A016UXW6_9BILA|nr:hypothetical protein Y032_0022g539 [Ancylostoma ceylanicum]